MPGEVFADRFRIEKHLGSGALATAFLVSAPGAAKLFCLKLLHPRKAAENHWAREWVALQQAVARYEARGIARIFEAGIFGNTPWCTMEYLPGPTLRMWMLETLRFEARIPAGLDMMQILIGVFDRIHELGCYGVLKPENIFVTPSGPVVTDFGVPGFLTPQEFEFNAYARRYLPYMAPELRQDYANLFPQSDYYSLGALLYEILTGRPPGFPVKLPSALSPLFGIEADEVVLKSLATNPRDRFGGNQAYSSALAALREALRIQRPEAFAATPASAVNPAPQDEVKANPEFEPYSEPYSAPQSDPYSEPPTGTSAVHAAAIVADPEQDFAPQQGMAGLTPLHGLDMPEREPETSGFNPFGLASAAKPSPVGLERPSEAVSQWALLESGMAESGLAETGPSHPSPARPRKDQVPVMVPAMASRSLSAESSVSEAIRMDRDKPSQDHWLASPPTPPWVWVLLVAVGLSLTVLAGYLGFSYGH